MTRPKHSCLILFTASFIIASVFFRADFAKLCITDYKGNGRYFSRQFDNNFSAANTLDYDKIGVSESISPAGVSYKFRKKDKEKVIIRVLKGIPYGEEKDNYKNLINVSLSSGNFIIFNKNASQLQIGNNIFEIPQDSLSKGLEFDIYLGRDDNELNNSAKEAIRRIEVAFLPENGNLIPNLPLILMHIFLPILLYVILLSLGLSENKSFTLGIIFIPLIYLLHSYLSKFSFLSLLLFLFVLMMFCLLLKFKNRKNLPYFVIYSFILLILLAFYLRWQELEIMAFAPPHPDARAPIGYKGIADNISFPLKGVFVPGGELGEHHERMYPLIVKIFFTILGSSDLHIRFVSVFFSMLVVILAYFLVAGMIKNRLFALLAVLILAVNGSFIENSVYGLRTEIEAFLLMVLFYLGFLKRDVIGKWLWSFSNGICASILVLIRGFYLPLTLFLMIYFAIMRREALKKKIAPLFLAIFIIIAPYLFWRIQIYNKHHSWTWDQESYCRDLVINEFGDSKGYILPSKGIAIYDYFFKIHSFFDTAKYCFAGTAGAVFLLNEYFFNTASIQNNFVKAALIEKGNAIRKHFSAFLLVSITLIVSFFSFAHILLNRDRRILFWIIASGLYYCFFFLGFFVIKGRALFSMDRSILPLLPFFIIGVLSFFHWGCKALLRRIPLKTMF